MYTTFKDSPQVHRVEVIFGDVLDVEVVWIPLHQARMLQYHLRGKERHIFTEYVRKYK